MIKKKKLRILLIGMSLFISNPFIFGQHLTSSSWGIGIISRINEPNRSGEINFPETSITVYKSPDGEIIGTLKKEAEINQYNNVILSISNTDKRVDVNDLREISYEGTCIKYHEEKYGFIRILPSTYKPGVWVKIAELQQRNYYPQPWSEFLLVQQNGFFTLSEVGLNLRSEPDIENNVIVLLKGDRFEINLTGKINGKWYEAEVIEYDAHPCVGDHKILKKWKGWVEALDSLNHPNIWFYTRGC